MYTLRRPRLHRRRPHRPSPIVQGRPSGLSRGRGVSRRSGSPLPGGRPPTGPV